LLESLKSWLDLSSAKRLVCYGQAFFLRSARNTYGPAPAGQGFSMPHKKTLNVRPRSWIRVFLCQLLLLSLVSYGLDFQCGLSAAPCAEATCCSDCSSPAHLSDSPTATLLAKAMPALVPSCEVDRLLATVDLATGQVEFIEREARPSQAPDLWVECGRGPPAQA
jgi:hypothetical protein